MGREKEPERVSGILASILERTLTGTKELPVKTRSNSLPIPDPEPEEAGATGRYDFDLAEFPLFRFHTSSTRRNEREPITYTDAILGKDGTKVTREWRAFPGPFGFGGPSTHTLLYDLLQLYVEQGAEGTQIQFGTLRSLFLRRGLRNPSKRDYDRLRRDIDVLRGYDFHCRNAFWDRKRQAYVDMKWRLFGSVFYFKEAPGDGQIQLPFGFIEVSPVLQQIARTRGFFALGFDNKLFYEMKPLEQRLAVYLAKKFVSQQVHRKSVDDLARALPIEASQPKDIRTALRKAADGLLEKQLPILATFRVEQKNGRWLAVFERKAAPRQDRRTSRLAAAALEPSITHYLHRITEAIGSNEDHLWWTHCIKRLGTGAVDRALGQLKEASQMAPVKNRGGLLTKIFKDIAEESGIGLR